MLDALEVGRAAGLAVETAAARPTSCPSPTSRSTSSSATRCCTTCPTSRRRSASSGACCAPAAWWPSAASRRATATASPRAQARRLALAPAVAALMGAGPRPSTGPARRRSEEDTLEPLVDVHAFTPADLNSHARGRRLRGRARERRGARRRPVRLGQPHARGDRRPADVPWAWRQYAYRGYLALQALDRRCSSRGCRRRSSTTC